MFICDVFHPIDRFSIQLFDNCDVRHSSSCGCTTPMLLSGGSPEYIAWTDYFNRATLSLNKTAARCDYESLSERVSVPCGASAWLKRYGHG